MKLIILVARRELQAFSKTWLGYLVFAAALLVIGLLFNTFAIGDKAKYSAEVLSDFFYVNSGMAMVAAIFLAMRLLAEEKQNNTIVLFFTSPITGRQLIYGKYLAVFLIFSLLQAISLYLPSLIFLQGKISIGHLFAGYLGVLLLGASVLAITLFTSVVASNQLLAVVFGAVLTVVLLLLWLLADRVDEPFSSFFSYVAIHNHRFNPFSQGIVHLKNIVYYLSLIIFFSEASIKALESRRLQG